ncbi:MAG: tetratricopeptide repeat protein [Planctomycetes bacterium]|nr:tetratricopeptide repeat protein [Planctomycetota bacterium]
MKPTRFRKPLALKLACCLLLVAQVSSGEGLDPSGQAAELLKSAAENAGTKRVEEAINDLQEIIEFFPSTPSWEEACLRLTRVAMEAGKVSVAESALERALLKYGAPSQYPKSLLVANWIFHFERGDMPGYTEWMAKLGPVEKSRLRESPEVISALDRISVRKEISEQLKLLEDLGFTDPESEILERYERLDLRISGSMEEAFVKQVAGAGKEKAFFSFLRQLIEAGEYRKAHEMMKAHSGKFEKWWSEIWLPCLIEGKMWTEGDELLALMPDTSSCPKERFLVHIGFKRWQAAYRLLKGPLAQAVDRFDISVLVELVKGLHDNNLTLAMAKDVVAMIGDAPLRTYLEAVLLEETQPAQAVTRYESLLDADAAVSTRAMICLAQLHLQAGRYGEARRILELLKTRHSGTSRAAEAAMMLKNMGILAPR